MAKLGSTRWIVRWYEVPSHATLENGAWVSTDEDFDEDYLIDSMVEHEEVVPTKSAGVAMARKIFRSRKDRLLWHFADIVHQVVVDDYGFPEWEQSKDFDSIRFDGNNDVEVL